jgi:hypothetical protein
VEGGWRAREPASGTLRAHTSGQRSDIMAATVPSTHHWPLAPNPARSSGVRHAV